MGRHQAAWAWLAVSLLAVGLAGPRADEVPARDRGYSYFREVVPEVPWSIHVFRMERAHRDLELCTTSGKGDLQGMATVSEQLRSLPQDLGQPLAAVNGDFYDRRPNYEGRPRDLQIRQGELVSAPAGHACFWVDAHGGPHVTNVVSRFRVTWPDGTTTPFGLNEERGKDAVVLYTAAVGPSTRTSGGVELVIESATGAGWLPLSAGRVFEARVRENRSAGDTALSREVAVLSIGPKLATRLAPVEPGATLRLATETNPDLLGTRVAIGGGPTLVRNGKAMQWSGLQLRHPRTALGWNQGNFFLVTVDGRQSDLSVGMTLPELAAYMVKLGCEHAMNLDGGGSATLWACGNVMSSPSEGRERPSVNALVVVQKKPTAEK